MTVTLCINVDHIATLRQARGEEEPDPVQGAVVCEESGAHGITVHLREDRRHIQDEDVFRLKEVVKGTYNLEMALSDEIIEIAKKLKPDQITLVPEKREEVTTEGGLDVAANFDRVKEVVQEFRGLGIVTSLFIEPDITAVDSSRESGADYIEIHTGTYCNAFKTGSYDEELKRILAAAEHGVTIGIGINAGHGLNTMNVVPVLAAPGLNELNIGHSIISRSVFTGISAAVKEMLSVIGSG